MFERKSSILEFRFSWNMSEEPKFRDAENLWLGLDLGSCV